jgi:SAM-dependent methyltransferase
MIELRQLLDELDARHKGIGSRMRETGEEAERVQRFYDEVREKFQAALREHGDVVSEEDFDALCDELSASLDEVDATDIENKVLAKITKYRSKTKRSMSIEAGWRQEPLRKGNKLTGRGIDALNRARSLFGMEKVFTDNEHFLREGLSEEQIQELLAIAQELGASAVTEVMCELYPERFTYDYKGFQNLREWLGRFEAFGGNVVENIPVPLLTRGNLSVLKTILFNRLRDRYLADYGSLENAIAELSTAKGKTKHKEQEQFIDELIEYCEYTKDRPLPVTLRQQINGGAFPADHQKVSVTEIERNGSFMLADEMGGGKTGSTITAFEHLKEQGKASKALIMCPAQIVPVWKKALSDNDGGYFEDGHAPSVAFIESENKEEGWEKARNADYVVMSIEMSRSKTNGTSHEQMAKELGVDFFAVDEAHNVKNPQGEDTERIFRMSQTQEILDGHLVLLTGTPVPNTIRDIAAQLRLLYTGREEVNGDLDFANLDKLTAAILKSHPLVVRNLLLPRMLRRTEQQSLPVEAKLYREVVETELSPVEEAMYESILDCPFYEASEKIRMLRQLCLRTETKYKQVCQEIENILTEPTDPENEEPVKIVIAESWFARGVTRDQQHKNDPNDSVIDEYIAGRLREDYDGLVKVFILDGNNSSQREQILTEFKECPEPAVLVTLTTVAGEGLDMSYASHGILLAPTRTVPEEQQWIKRQHRKGQKRDVKIRVLQIADSIEKGIAEYAARKYELVEEFLNGRPLSHEEEDMLTESHKRIKKGGFLAYETMTKRQKLMWIFNKIYGKGKDEVRAFFEMDEGKYADDLAALYPEDEETSYQGNNARLVAGLLGEELANGDTEIADIGCGCLTMHRMLAEQQNVTVWSSDICKTMLATGRQLAGNVDDRFVEECAMDELPYEDGSMDVATTSLALHYTRHNPRISAGKERINALREMNRILREGGTGVITLPVHVFEDQHIFEEFCRVLESFFGFEIDMNRSGLARSVDNPDEDPFEVYVITVTKTGEAQVSEMSVDDWSALAFAKLRTSAGGKKQSQSPDDDRTKEYGAYHEEFELGSQLVKFDPLSDDQTNIRDEHHTEKQKHQRLEERIQELTNTHGSMDAIPEELLLSISLEEVNAADQASRDEYFRALLGHYGNIYRVPVEEISATSPVILIRGRSRKGPFLCLGRVDGTGKKACGYGRRYFYEE